jgi:hypothetical protein
MSKHRPPKNVYEKTVTIIGFNDKNAIYCSCDLKIISKGGCSFVNGKLLKEGEVYILKNPINTNK